MAGEKLEKAREAAIEAVRRLGPRDLFALVIYDHSVETLVPRRAAANIEWIEARIPRHPAGRQYRSVRRGQPGGGRGAQAMLDGPYVPPGDPALRRTGQCRSRALRRISARLGAALLKEGISVTTIGVGTDFNEDLMARLAARSDGNHYFVAASSDLSRIFAAELGDVLSVVARKVVIEIDCPAECGRCGSSAARGRSVATGSRSR